MRKFYSFVLILTAALCSFSNSAWGDETVLSEGFESNSLSTNSWTKTSCHSNSIITNAEKRSGSYAFRFYYNSTPPQYLISKELSIPAGSEVSLSFWYKAQSASWAETFQVGYSTTTNATSSFTWGSEVSTATTTTTWTEYTDNSLPANTKYIAIKYNSNDKYYLWIDDILVTYAAASPCPKPAGLSASASTSTSATITWTRSGTETAWDLQYSDDIFSTHTELNLTTSEVSLVSNNCSYTLSGLDPQTTYKVKVRANCGGGDGESDWTSTVSFTTPCGEDELPFLEDFKNLTSGIPECWDNSEGTTTTDSYKWNQYNSGHSHSKSVMFNSRDNTSGNTNFLNTKAVKVQSATTLKFWYKNVSGGDLSVYYSFDGGSTKTLLASGLTGASDWTERICNIPAQATEKSMVVIFKGTSNYYRYGTTTNAYIFVDDIRLYSTACTGTVTSLSNSSVGTKSAVISWTSSASEWKMRYRIGTGKWTVVNGITSKPYTLTGLKPGKTYEVQVADVCGENSAGQWSTSTTFTTLYGIPFDEDFDGIASGIPSGWDNTEGTVSSSTSRWQYYATGNSGHCVYFDSYVPSSGQYDKLKTPAISVDVPAKLSFYYKNPKAGDFSVYYKIDNGSETAFAGLTGLTGKSSWTYAEANLPPASIEHNITIIFKGTSNYGTGTNTDYYIYLDDVKIEGITDCGQPKDVTASAETNSTAHIAWTARAGITSYQYCVVARDAAPDWSGNLTAETNSVDLSALSASTDYDFYVRCVCGVDEYSDVSDVCQFSTTAGCPTPSGVSFSNQTHNSATVTWTAGGSEAAWNLRYKAGSGEWTTPVRLTSRTYNLTGLTTGTTYTVEVQADCGGTWVSNTYTPTCPSLGEISKSAMTACGVTLSWSAGGSETGWNVHYKAGAGAYGDPIHVTSPTYTLTGLTTGTTYYYQVQADCGGDWTTVGSYTPVCPVPGMPTFSNQTYNSVRVSWTAGNCEDSWNLRYKKGEDEWTVVSDLTSRTYDATGLVAGNEYTFQVQAGCEGTWSASSTYTPVCPQPGTITLTNQKYDRVTVGWAKGGTEDAWRLRYKAADGDWIVKEANTASNSGHVIDGLTSGVTYTIEVTASCCAGGSARTTTYTPSCAQPGAITLSNRTHSSAQVAWAASGTLDRWNLQYKVASAEDVPANWTNVVMNTASRSGHTISGLTTDVTYTIRVTAACCSADPQDIEYTPVCATPASASVTNIRDVQASASWSAVSGSGITTFQYIVVARDATPDWSEATTVSATSATLTGLSVATNYDFYVRSKCADGNYSESLKQQFATTAQMPGATITNTDLTHNSATFTWTQGGAETQYQWACKTSGTPSAGDWSEPLVTGVREVTVTGLAARTNYTFYVRSYYSADVTSSYRSKAFTTECGPITVDAEHPWTYGFEDVTVGYGSYNIPDCWSKIAYGNYPYVYNYYYRSGSKCLYMHGGTSSSSQYIILPTFENVNNLTLTFYYKAEEDASGYYSDYIYAKPEIGYMTDASNAATFIRLGDALPQSESSYTLAEQVITGVPDGARIAIRYAGDGSITDIGNMYIDDIAMSVSASCLKPVNPTCTATTSSSATLAWTENGAATAWEIEYSTHSDFSSPSTIIAAATNPFTLSDLNQNTQYYARVRGVCDEEDKSEWSTTSASFRTACGGSYASDDMPFRFDFESDTEVGSDGRIPYCWSSIAYTQNASNIYPHVSSTGGRTAQCLCFYGGTSTSTQYITLPDMEDNLMSLTIEFYYKNYSTNTDYGQFTVGYLTTPGDASTFVAVQALDRVNNTYTKASVDLKSVPASVHAITIRYGGATSTLTYDYIDDIVVYPTAKIFTDGGGDGLWSNTANWMMGVLPTAEDSVIVRKPVAVDIATAKAKSVILDQTGTNTGAIDIAPAGELVISGTLRKATGTAESKIYSPTAENDVNIGSSADGLGGLVMGSHATANGLNDATVNFYSLSHGSSGSTASVSQYLGTPFSNNPKMLYQFYNSWVYKFTNTGTPSWERVNGDDGLEAFAGYAVISADPVGHTYWMQGTLVASENQNISLQFNSGDGSNPDNENMLANSWMAPIQIRAFNAATDFTNADATIYIFNSGSPDDYETNNGASTTGALAGQYSAYTPGSAAATDVIPAMQAFSVYTSAADASITLDYNRLVYAPAVAGLAITPNRAPQRTAADADESNEPAKMRLFVNAVSGYGDMLYMLEREDFSEDFENGWDARKMFGESVAPQLYAITPDGNMAINCVPTFEGTILGFRKGANDNGYTFTFDYDGADSWYLLDLKEQVSTLITTNSSYMFVAAADDLAARFIISRTPLNYTDGVATGVDNHTTSTASQKLLIDGVLYIIRNGRIYSAEGALLK